MHVVFKSKLEKSRYMRGQIPCTDGQQVYELATGFSEVIEVAVNGEMKTCLKCRSIECRLYLLGLSDE